MKLKVIQLAEGRAQCSAFLALAFPTCTLSSTQCMMLRVIWLEGALQV